MNALSLLFTLSTACDGTGKLHGTDSADTGDTAAAIDSGDSADTNDTNDSGDTGEETNPYADNDGDGLPDAWANADYWASGPLSSLILPTELPTATHWEVRVATSADGVAWVPDERVIAWGISSLDLLVAGDTLVIAGMIDGEAARELPPDVQGYTIPALATTDLLTWGSKTWTITGGNDTNLVDPSLQLGSDGLLRAAWFAHSEPGVDPATIEGVHNMQRGTWSETGTFAQDDADPEYAYEWLVDPVICELGETQWLFYTNLAERVYAAHSPDGGEHFDMEASFSWEGPSVPFCISGDDDIRVIGQTPAGKDAPLQGILTTDGTFTETGPLYAEHPWGENCTSPVLGYWKDQWVLACAVQVKGDE
ncbi:hypothetical protein LBMAG42_08870 [Deltaproteobacteria bacterium]|nr:hypothetical protein LBMAG42_08870 [Deltaproteobacteria bacterium]